MTFIQHLVYNNFYWYFHFIEPEEKADEDSDSEFKRKATRYYDDEDKSVRCRNCGEAGHIARKCPYELKQQFCGLWGYKSHDSNKQEACDFILCFKCNGSGHTANACKIKDLVVCPRWKYVGHPKEKWLIIEPNPYYVNDNAICYTSDQTVGELKAKSNNSNSLSQCDTRVNLIWDDRLHDTEVTNKLVSLIQDDFKVHENLLENLQNTWDAKYQDYQAKYQNLVEECQKQGKEISEDLDPEEIYRLGLIDESDSDIEETDINNIDELVQIYDSKMKADNNESNLDNQTNQVRLTSDEQIDLATGNTENIDLPDNQSNAQYWCCCGKSGHSDKQCKDIFQSKLYLRYTKKAQNRRRINEMSIKNAERQKQQEAFNKRCLERGITTDAYRDREDYDSDDFHRDRYDSRYKNKSKRHKYKHHDKYRHHGRKRRSEHEYYDRDYRNESRYRDQGYDRDRRNNSDHYDNRHRNHRHTRYDKSDKHKNSDTRDMQRSYNEDDYTYESTRRRDEKYRYKKLKSDL